MNINILEIMVAKKKAGKKGLASADKKTKERVARKGGKS
jgi:general stress protein YciG